MAFQEEIMLVLGYREGTKTQSVSVPWRLLRSVAAGEIKVEALDEIQFKAFNYKNFIVLENGNWIPSKTLLFKAGLIGEIR